MITPSDSPSSPSGYAEVTPHGQGPAPYDLQAPQADLSGTFDAAVSAAEARQPETRTLIASPQGFGEFDITAGYHVGPGQDGWPANIEPGA
jgi:hypothetical protein